MFCSVICFTCGLPVGHLNDIYDEAKAEKLRKYLSETGINPSDASIAPEMQIDCQDIFERLGVWNDCCRMRLTCKMTYTSYY
jgi:DNA-directed RNA polymerase subunit N (RpoN/RPB10)